MSDIVDYLRIYAIEQATKNGFSRLPDNSENRGCNQQADDWISKRKSQPNPRRATDYCKAGQTIGTGVVAIGDQGGAIDLAADSDPKAGGEGVIAGLAPMSARYTTIAVLRYTTKATPRYATVHRVH